MLCVGLIGWMAACGPAGGPAARSLEAALVPVVLDKGDPERLLRYYFGGYAAPEGADPFARGLLVMRDGHYYVHLDSLEARYPGAASLLVDANRDTRFDWDELEAFIEATYYTARQLPPSLADLQQAAPYATDTTRWMRLELDGVMTNARRRLFVSRDAIRQALRAFHANGEQVLYPVGTVMVGEHYLEGRRVETTAMRKRADGYWDFFVYGRNDSLAAQTGTGPRVLKAPVQCVGCHFGNRLFEPEESFPARALPGPHGPRQLYVDAGLRDAEVTTFFNEHRKRSYTILGVYSTLFVAQLRAERRAGRLAPEDAALLEALQL